MINKKIILMPILATSLLLSACGNNNSNEKPADVTLKKGNDDVKIVEDQTTEEISTEAPVKKEFDKEINLENVKDIIKSMHDFDTIDYKLPDEIQKSLKDNHIVYKDFSAKPYREFFQDKYQMTSVRAGIVTGPVEIKDENTLHPKFIVKTKTFSSVISVRGSENELAKKIKHNLEKNPMMGDLEQTITYQLDLSKDKSDGILKRLSKWNYQ